MLIRPSLNRLPLETIALISVLISGNLMVEVLASYCPEHCVCPTVQTRRVRGKALECVTPDTLHAVPQMEEDTDTILEIIIRYQPRLTHLSGISLRNYSRLRLIDIESSGLQFIAEDAFLSNPAIKHIYLSNNTIERFQETLVKHLSYTELWLDDNPLACNCSNAWLGEDEALTASRAEYACVPNDGQQASVKNTRAGGENISDYRDVIPMSNLTLLQECDTPNIFIRPAVVEAREGTSVNITCASGNTPGLLWLRWEGLGDLANKSQVVEGQGSSLLEVSGLTINDHYKQLTCAASNDVGTRHAHVRIHVPRPPRIEQLKVTEGNYVRVGFVFSGWPKPTVTWYKSGVLSQGLPHILDTVEEEADPIGMWMGRRRILVTMPVVSGNYTLVIENSEGSTNQTIAIKGNPAPRRMLSSKSLYDQETVSRPKPSKSYDLEDESGVNSTSSLTGGTENSIENVLAIVIPTIFGTIFVILALIAAMLVFRRRKRKSRVTSRCERKMQFVNRKQDDFREVMPLTGVPLMENPNYETQKKKYDKLKSTAFRHIKLETILLIQQIGEGAFGHVLLGKCAHLFKKDEFTNVAVKTLKGNSEETIKRDFEKEAELLATLNHPNIVTFFGVCTEGDQWMMLFEFMEYGDLNNFLRSYGPNSAMLRQKNGGQINEVLSVNQLLSIVIQISEGMEYLASQHFIHRDLATRNCLVGKGHVVKIGDFGMSKDVYCTDYYKVGDAAMLPVRWMPPESIMYRTFTIKSDVWSFGITLWEVFTYGTQPWFEYSNLEVIDKIKDCIQLSKPPECPDSVYSIMAGCWKPSPCDRLTMKEINKLLQIEMESLQPSYLDVIA